MYRKNYARPHSKTPFVRFIHKEHSSRYLVVFARHSNFGNFFDSTSYFAIRCQKVVRTPAILSVALVVITYVRSWMLSGNQLRLTARWHQPGHREGSCHHQSPAHSEGHPCRHRTVHMRPFERQSC